MLYGYKVEVFVVRNGFEIGSTPLQAGSVADIEIIRPNILLDQRALAKEDVENDEIENKGETAEEDQGVREFMEGKGCQEI